MYGVASKWARKSLGVPVLLVKICVVIGACEQCLNINVVEPSGLFFERFNNCNIKHVRGTLTYDVLLLPHVTPSDVSFGKVVVIERESRGDAEGVLEPWDGSPHGANNRWVRVAPTLTPQKGSKIQHPDQVAIESEGEDFVLGEGSIIWNIKWEFRLASAPESSSKELTRVNQAFVVSEQIILGKKGDLDQPILVDSPTQTEYFSGGNN